MINLADIWDVIIIGSGPAGCAAGLVLARKGINVLIIEKEKLPRHKICSGLISRGSQKILKKLGLKFPEAICTRPKVGKGIKVQFKIGNNFIDIPDKYYNVWRRDFDYWLTIEANKAGAVVEDETEMIDINFEEYIKVKVRYIDPISGEKRIKEYATKYVIGADGSKGKTRKIIYPDFKRETGIAYQEYWTGKIDLDPRYFYAFMDRELSAGYAFCNLKEDQILIGVGAIKGKNIKKYQAKFIEFLKEGFNLRLDKMIRKEGCVSTNIFKQDPTFKHLHGKNNVLLTGEAADLFNIMGEGIPSALISGKNAAEAIIENISGDTKDVVENYKEKNKKLVTLLEKNWEGYIKQYDSILKI